MSEIITPQEVAEVGRVERLKPTEADFTGKPGHWRKYRADGTYEWGFKFRPNEDGKLTRDAEMVGEMFRPHNRAALEHQSLKKAAKPRETLRDGDGRVHFVDARLAPAAAARNGWHHHWRPRGNPVERGRGGMLWRWAGRWEPLGVRCLGTPLFGRREVDEDSVQFDPDGEAWEHVDGEWRAANGQKAVNQ